MTEALEVIIDAEGRIMTLMHGSGEEGDGERGLEIGIDGQLQEKWHLTTFTSCHTFDATFTYCGL